MAGPETLSTRRLIREAYDESAPRYARSASAIYGPLGELLVTAVPTSPEELVLDLGTGAGAVGSALVNRSVVGLDLSPEQLRHNPLQLRVAADAEALPFPDGTFDVAFGGFWIGHFPDPARPLAGVRRVLRPGGRIGLSTWARPESSYRPKEIVLEALSRVAGAQRIPAAVAVEEMTNAIGSPAVLGGALERAGFEGVSVRHVVHPVRWPGAEAFLEYRLSLLGVSSLLDAGSSARLRAEVIGQLEALGEGERLWRVGVLIAQGTRPAVPARASLASAGRAAETAPMAKPGSRRSAPRAVRIQLLGKFSVYRDGELLEDKELGSLKGRLLLKLLALRRGHLVPMDQIVEVLWPDGAPALPEGNVAVLVSRLRSVVGGRVLQGGRPGYMLQPGPGCSIDLDDAKRLVVEAGAAADRGDPASARTAADAALSMLGGADLLEDEPYAEWAESERVAARRLLSEAGHLGAELAARRGDHEGARYLAEALVDAEPLDEAAVRRLILARYRLGDKAGALAAYELLRSTLAEELGADPSRETQELHLSVLRDEDLSGESAEAMPSTGPLGRMQEISQLESEWEQARDGGPSMVLVLGEPGIGKSYLAEMFAERVERAGALVLRAQCYEMEQSLVLQPIADALRNALLRAEDQQSLAALRDDHVAALGELIPEVGAWMDIRAAAPVSPEAQRHRWFVAIASLLDEFTRRHPVLLLIDDTQYATRTTLEFVHALSRRRLAGPLLILGLARDEEADFMEMIRPIARTIRLGPLDRAAVTELADRAGVADEADVLQNVCGGNPLYILEAIRSLKESGTLQPTDSVRDAIADRLDRTGREVGEFLRAASIVGFGFDLHHVAEMLEIPSSRAVRLGEDALRRGLLRESGYGYLFGHEIVRAAIYEGIPGPTRVAWHRRLAHILDERGERDEVVGHHASLGMQHDVAARAYLSAARRAVRSFANVEAERLLVRSLESADKAGEEDLTAEILLERGGVRTALDAHAAAAEDLRRGLLVARKTANVPLEARILEQLGFSHYSARNLDGAQEYAELALAHPHHSGGAGVLSARVHHALGVLEVAEKEARDALAAARSDEDHVAEALARSYLGSIKSHADQYSSAVELLEVAEQTSRSVGLFRSTFNSLFFLGHALGNQGDIARAFAVFEKLLAEAREMSSIHYETRALNCLAWLWLEVGDPARAIDLAQESADKSDDPSFDEPRANGLLVQADGALRLGDPERATSLAERAGRLGVGAAYGWRLELRLLELRARIGEPHGLSLATLARKRGAPKYEALGLALAGERARAAEIARRIDSDLLLSKVAPVEEATAAADRIASGLPENLAAPFMRVREGTRAG